MRDTFIGYYRPTDAEFSDLWENCIFIFDANILLNIYRYSEETREKFMLLFEKASPRIKIPYQAAKEFQDNRLDVIKSQQDAYDNIIKNIKENFNTIESSLNSFKRHPKIDVKIIKEDLNTLFNAFETDLIEKKEKHPNLFRDDDLRNEITVLLDKKIGNPYSNEELDEIYEEGEIRFKDQIPPGFKDSDKDGVNKYGDLILWYQIIDIAKEEELPIIFITDDKKEDWWWIFKGRTIGPRQELIEEIRDKANVCFYMYKTDQFIKHAENYFFKKDADPKFIEEVKDVMWIEKPASGLIIDKNFIEGTPWQFASPWRSSLEISDNELFNIIKKYSYDLELIENRISEIKNGKYFSSSDLSEIESELNFLEINIIDIKDSYDKTYIEIRNFIIETQENLDYLIKIESETSSDDLSYVIEEINSQKNLINHLESRLDKINIESERASHMINKIRSILFEINKLMYKRKYKR